MEGRQAIPGCGTVGLDKRFHVDRGIMAGEQETPSCGIVGGASLDSRRGGVDSQRGGQAKSLQVRSAVENTLSCML